MDKGGNKCGSESGAESWFGCRKTFLIRVGLVSIVALVGLLAVVGKDRKQRLLVISCTNHANHVRMGMVIRSSDDHSWEIPHIRDVAGFKVLYASTLYAPGGLECNHGARRRMDGGWQFVNASPEIWAKLFDALDE